jgi:hypothetical protein
MNQQIKGYRYNYSIRLTDTDYFEIIAIRKQNKRYSTITNFNTIISEIIEPVLKIYNIEDTIIKVDKQIGKKLFDLAFNTLNDKQWIKYLEKKLDEDFEMGGWNGKLRRISPKRG